jgi:hypothetical protein
MFNEKVLELINERLGNNFGKFDLIGSRSKLNSYKLKY